MAMDTVLAICGLFAALLGVAATHWWGRRTLDQLRRAQDEFLRRIALDVEPIAVATERGGGRGPRATPGPVRRPIADGGKEPPLSPRAGTTSAVRRACVGVADVTNDRRVEFLTQVTFEDRAELKVMGIDDRSQTVLSASLYNHTGYPFHVEDRDDDGRVEVVTVDAEGADGRELVLKTYRWLDGRFVEVGRTSWTDLAAHERRHYGEPPAWCA